MKSALAFLITGFGLHFKVTQYRWGRKLYGGNWYLIETIQLRMAPFWSDIEIKSCQSKTLQTEQHLTQKQ